MPSNERQKRGLLWNIYYRNCYLSYTASSETTRPVVRKNWISMLCKGFLAFSHIAA
jgi:hypothetical protein